jgi:hypothetical protein
VIGVGLAVAAGKAAAQVGDLAGGDRDEPPFRRRARIDLDLADRALELGEVTTPISSSCSPRRIFRFKKNLILSDHYGLTMHDFSMKYLAKSAF